MAWTIYEVASSRIGHFLLSLALVGWTLRGAIQPHIDVYLSQETFSEVRRSFPYLVSKQFASGGGDVGKLVLSRELLANIIAGPRI